MAPTTITYRYPGGWLLTCCHHDPSVMASWLLERIHGHHYDHDTRTEIDGGLVASMEDAVAEGQSAVEFHSRNTHHDARRPA